MTAPFDDPDPPDVVAGFFRVATRARPSRRRSAPPPCPTVEEIDPARFLPSSRSVAFTRRAWEQVGGYPEWLDYCEDLVFDFALRGRRLPLRPRRRTPSPTFARARSRAPSSASTIATRAATGRPISGASATPFATRPTWGCPLGLLLARRWPWLLGLLALAAAGVRAPAVPAAAARPAGALAGRSGWWRWPGCRLIRLIGDVAKMLGYPVGLLWRLRHASEIPLDHPRR